MCNAFEINLGVIKWRNNGYIFFLIYTRNTYAKLYTFFICLYSLFLYECL